MSDRRWWEIAPLEAAFLAAYMVASAWLFGPPEGWDWLVLPFALLGGLWLWRVAVPWLWARRRG